MKLKPEHRDRLDELGLRAQCGVVYRNQLKAGLSRGEAYEFAIEACLSGKETGLSVPNVKPLESIAVLADFGGREANEVDVIRWVARNMDVLDVQPRDCPDPMAWSLLQRCRRDPDFATDFWKSLFPKVIPAKGAREDEKVEDNTPLLETIKRVEELASKARGAA